MGSCLSCKNGQKRTEFYFTSLFFFIDSTYMKTSLDHKIVFWQLGYPALHFQRVYLYERNCHPHLLPLWEQILGNPAAHLYMMQPLMSTVKLFFNTLVPLLCLRPQLCYLHSLPRSFRGHWRLMEAEAGGGLWKDRGSGGRLWNLCIPPEKVGGILFYPPPSHFLPTSIIKCTAAAGVKERRSEKNDALLSHLLSLNKGQ